MKLKLLSWWQLLYRSYWFLPTLMSILALVLAFGMVQMDEWLVRQEIEALTFLPRSDAAGGRAILSTIAGSSITVAGVVFSITIVVLSTAATQFGPGLLPNFMNQRPTQIVLGGFIATFIYCLIILSHIKQSEDPPVPHYSLSIGLLLGIVSFAFLIYFIHHVAMFIQVPRILSDVSHDLHFALRGVFPERGQGDGRQEQPELPGELESNCYVVCSKESNYVQAINYESLLELAKQYDLIISIAVVPGEFLLKGETIFTLYPADAVDNDLIDTLRSNYLLGDERTSTQDPLFAVDQIIEIAVRALSPGINDPYTALACINKLGEALAHMAERDEPLKYWHDDQGRIRLVRACNGYDSVLDRTFDQLRAYGADHVVICKQLMEMIRDLSRFDLPAGYRAALDRHAALLIEVAKKADYVSADRERLEQLFQDFRQNMKAT